jgi:hypothetical protein
MLESNGGGLGWFSQSAVAVVVVIVPRIVSSIATATLKALSRSGDRLFDAAGRCAAGG